MEGLTNRQQALLMLVAFVLTPVSIWSGSGMPTDRVSIGLLISNVCTGIILFVKEMLGGKAPPA